MMIEFKDVTGEVTKRPGEHFWKMDSISDAQIEEYKSRGAVIVKMDPETHAHALKLKTSRELLQAQEALGSVRAAAEMEDLQITHSRQLRQSVVDKAKDEDAVATANLAKAKEEAAKIAQDKKDAKKPKGKKK